MTLPWAMKVTTAAMLEARFTTLVLALAVTKSYFSIMVKKRIRNIPMPGPKKPS